MYEYRACPQRVVDGDTIDLLVDMGFHMTATLRFRVLGIDTPEIRRGTDEEKVAGQAAKARVEELMKHAVEEKGLWPIRVRTEKADSFGRWLADIYLPSDLTCLDGMWRFQSGHEESVTLSKVLLHEGHAKVYVKRR